MIAHALKILWNRKTSNLLLLLELTVSFLVVFAVASSAVTFFRRYRKPLGFDYENQWAIIPKTQVYAWDEAKTKTIRDLTRDLSQIDGVDAVAPLFQAPFEEGGWRTTFPYRGQRIRIHLNLTSDNFLELANLRLLSGRWLSPEDEGQKDRHIVINQYMAETLFPGEDPIGRVIADDEPNENSKGYKVIGVIEDFRQTGEFGPDAFYAFFRYETQADLTESVYYLTAKVRPGSGPQLQEEIIKRSREIAGPGWDFKIDPWPERRARENRATLAPVTIMAVLALFLMLMVGMGMLGVLWQNVTRRLQEMGIRRALGAASTHIHLQITTELLVLTGIAIIIGTALGLQIPLLGIFGNTPAASYAWGVLIAAVIMLALSFTCSLYPRRLATTLSPALALRDE